MQASSLYYIFITSIVFAYPSIEVSIGKTSAKIISSKTNVIETSSSLPTIKEKATILPLSSSASSSSKQLENDFTTKKYELENRNLIKGIVVTTPAADPLSLNTYRVNDSEDGTTCILMTVDALITFIYTTKFNEVEEGDTFVPPSDNNKVSLSGDCSSGEKSSMLLKWDSYSLNFDFTKTPGGERWFVNGVQLSFNTKEKTFKHIIYGDVNVRAENVEGEILYPTPVGRSFKCHRELEINLFDPEYPDLKVKLLLRELTLEPFIFKNNDFGSEYLCAAAGVGSFRSEIAPFIFGSLLTIASLLTVGGYAVYRYMKVNKVQYDAME